MMFSAITLTTDFGTRDSYVAQMKGEILKIAPAARIIDVTHAIPSGDVLRGALALRAIVGSFPEGTIHVAVVDPGVGSERRLVAVEMGEQRFVGPDNGLFGLIAREHPPRRIARLDNPAAWRAVADDSQRSRTFHGREILAPVAARWSLDVEITALGSLTTEPLQDAPLPKPQSTAGGWRGEVIAVDHFGNLITNIDRAELANADPTAWSIGIAGHSLRSLHGYYAEVAAGVPLALIGSSGLLEIAVNQGSAAEQLAATIGTPVICRRGD